MYSQRLIIRNRTSPVGILYFHGLLATPGFWLPCIKSELNISHVLLDYELSDFLYNSDKFLDNISNTIDFLLRSYAYKKLYVFGHSLGARIAQLIPFDIPKVYFAPVVRTSFGSASDNYLYRSFAENNKCISSDRLVEKVFSNQFFSFDINKIGKGDYVFQPISDQLTDLIMLPADNIGLYLGDHYELPDNNLIFEHVKH